MKYNALLIDDEEGNRELLKRLLKQHCLRIGFIDQAASAKEALDKIQLTKPDVVFLDIEMPGGSGFDFLNEAGDIDFKIIFVTAYDSYALRAIKYSALDYLLKPVDPKELIHAVEKLEEQIGQQEKIDLLSYNLSHDQDRRIALATQEEVIFARVSDIIRLQAEANYTKVFMENEPTVLLSGNLGHFEKLLKDQRFYRTHQSHLVNMKHVRKYVKTEGGYFLMDDGSQVPIARMKRDELKRLFT
ncbi:response regulator transcription factor [Algoriphagus lutimaris]|uniref:LytR/AlgR family response regulator transcription factor n=1 Tax=Algoriphagus lutimaris TaxID=613197 RepID=UPI00196B4C0C|nr:LytTR family DNA-binding domain-containing protein [Algoriphagus lutimaris]MBN3519228.1 response regulator transcription factor [Algoriphagus lutimaris]